MSAMSSTTASARDRVPFDNTNLQNHMCVLTLTKRDGTPFDVTSILEEDIVQICIRQGHTHPMGVLCYSAMESVFLFQLGDEIQCTTCGAIKAIFLCKEAIAVRASAPSKTHMRAYMNAVVNLPEPKLHP